MSRRLRQRLYPTLPRSPLDGWCARGLMALALSGGTASALWFFKLGHLPLWLAVLLPTALLLGPQLSRLRSLGPFLQQHHRLQCQLLALLLAVTFGRFHPDASFGAWTLFLLLAVHGFALRYSRPDNLAAVALLIPLIEIQLANAVLWPMGWIARTLVAAWMLITLLMVIGIATWLHARWTRRRLRVDRYRFENSAETGDGLWDRVRLMLVMGLLLVPLGLALQQLALFVTPQPSEISTVTVADYRGNAADAASWADESDGNAEDKSAASTRALKRELVLPSAIEWQGKFIQADKETVVFHLISDRDRNRSEDDKPYFSTTRPLYLLATTYDRLDRGGLSRGPSSEVIYHSDSGVGANNWIIFDEDLVNHPVMKFQIRQRLLFNDADGVKGTRGYLLHDRRLVAMRLPSCRLDEDGTALGELTSGELLAYQWWSQPVAQDVTLMPAAAAESRYLELPDEVEFQDWILEARELCFDTKDPEKKIARIVAHFKRNFSYDLEPSEANGIAAFSDFFAKRRGYCSYFASAGMLFLRANGIASRVASGFVVTEYSDTVKAYVGRLSNAHAWVEVQQQDGSWRTIDPTPSSSRNALLAALRLEQDTDALLENRDDEQAAAAVAEEQPMELAVGKSFFGLSMIAMVLSLVLPFLVCALLIGTLWVRLRNRHRYRQQRAALNPEARQAMDYWARIQHLLNELGFRSKRSQSAAEFTQQVQHWGGEFYRPLSMVTTLIYRSRFGGYAWSERQQQYLDEYEGMLERKVQGG